MSEQWEVVPSELAVSIGSDAYHLRCGAKVIEMWAVRDGAKELAKLLNADHDAERVLADAVAALRAELEAMEQAFTKRNTALVEMAGLLGVEVGGGPLDGEPSSYDLPERLLVKVTAANKKAALADRYAEGLRFRQKIAKGHADLTIGEETWLDRYDALERESGETQ